jgi:hypothetical protein
MPEIFYHHITPLFTMFPIWLHHISGSGKDSRQKSMIKIFLVIVSLFISIKEWMIALSLVFFQ